MSSEPLIPHVSRRHFLKALGAGTVLMLINACSPAATTAPTTAPALTTAPAATATTAAAAPTTVVAPTSAAAATSAPVATAAGSTAGGVLTAAWGWPDHLNPLIASSARQWDVLRRVHTRLVQWSKDLGKIQPELATEWAFSDGDKTMTFRLNPNAKWHDGQAVTSADVIYSLTMAMTSATGSRWRALMADVVGYDDYQKNGGTVKGFEAPNANTLIIRTTQPSPALWTTVLPLLAIMPEHVLKGVAPDKLREHPQMLFQPIGSGQFKLTTSQDRQFVQLDRWDGWWGKRPNIARIVGRVLDQPTQVASLEKGDLDYGGSYHPFPTDVERLRKAANLYEIKQQGVIPNNLAFNVRKPYLADKRIRQAVSYAINRQVVAGQVMKGLFVPWQTHFGYAWLQPIKDFKEYTFDPAKARQLLKDANYDTSKELDFVLSTKDPSDDLVVIQQMLADVGIKLKFRASLEPANTEDRQKGNFDMWGGGGIGWDADPSGLLTQYGCGLEPPAGLNTQGFCDPDFDAAMKKGASSLDENIRKPFYWQAANILNDDLPQVFIMLRVNTYFANKRLKNATPQGTALPNDDGLADWTLEG